MVEENVGSTDEQTYTKQLIERFDKDDSLKLLIVVDKLLTGFDEPKTPCSTSTSHLRSTT